MPKQKKTASKKFIADAGKWLSKEKQCVKVPRVPDVKRIPRRVLSCNKTSASDSPSIMNFFQRRLPSPKVNDVFDKENDQPKPRHPSNIHASVKYRRECLTKNELLRSDECAASLNWSRKTAFSDSTNDPDSMRLSVPKSSGHSMDVQPQSKVIFERPEFLPRPADLSPEPKSDIYSELPLDFEHFNPVATSTQILNDSNHSQASKIRVASAGITTSQQKRQGVDYPDSSIGLSRARAVARHDGLTLARSEHRNNRDAEGLWGDSLEDASQYKLSMRFTQDSQGNRIFCRLSPTKAES